MLKRHGLYIKSFLSRMKNIGVLIALLWCDIAFPRVTKRIDVYLSFNECNTCIAALTNLRALEGFDKQLVVAKADSLFLPEFFADRFALSFSGITYVNKKLPTFSYCKVYFNNVLADSFRLRDLSEKIALLNAYQIPITDTVSFTLPPLVFNKDQSTLSVHKNYVSIYDYTLNKLVLLKLDVEAAVLSQTLELKGKQFEPILFLRAGKLDSNYHAQKAEALKNAGSFYPKVTSAFINDTSLFLLLNFPYPQPLADGNTGVYMKFFIYQRHLATQKRSLTYINDFSLSLTDECFLDTSKPFFLVKDTLLLPYYCNTSKTPFHLFSKWAKTQSNYEQKGLHVKYDKRNYALNKVDSFELLLSNGIYFSIKGGLVYHINSGKIISLKKNLLRKEEYIQDIILNEAKQQLKLLVVNERDTYFIRYYDLKTQTIKQPHTFRLPASAIWSTLKLVGASQGVFLTSDFSKLKLFPLK